MSFDAATITVEQVPSLTGQQAREVAEHYHAPALGKSAKVADLRAVAELAIRAHTPLAAIEAPAAGEPDVLPTLEERPGSVIPSESRFNTIMRIAQVLGESTLVPEALRKKPNDIAAVLLRANDLGIPLTAGLDQLYVIKGKVGMEAKLMRALVRRDGHSINPVVVDDPQYRAIVHGKRVDNGDEDEAEFTLDDAVDQGLISSWRVQGDAIQVVAASGKEQWKKIPRTMMKNRATSILCRDLFSDCLAGVTYTPDELGDIGDVIPEAPAEDRNVDQPLTAAQTRAEMESRVAALDPDLVDEVRAAWRDRRLPPMRVIEGAAAGQALRIIAAAEAKQAEREQEHDEAAVLACAICRSEAGPFEESTDGDSDVVRCVDRQACMDRAATLAAANVAAAAPEGSLTVTEPEPATTPAEPAVEPGDGTVAVVACREPGGCPNPAVEDGYCTEHAPM